MWLETRLLKCHARREMTVEWMHFQGVFIAHLAETVAKGNGAALLREVWDHYHISLCSLE